MTNDDAIKWLNDLLKSDLDMPQYEDAIETAIKALNDLKKARKEAKRYKRKYLMLKAEIDPYQKDMDEAWEMAKGVKDVDRKTETNLRQVRLDEQNT